LEEIWRHKDAVGGQKLAYNALGLDDAYITRIEKERRALA